MRIVFGGLASKTWRAHQMERRLEGVKVSTAQIRAELSRELDIVAHPLRNNTWKLDAAVGLLKMQPTGCLQRAILQPIDAPAHVRGRTAWPGDKVYLNGAYFELRELNVPQADLVS